MSEPNDAPHIRERRVPELIEAVLGAATNLECGAPQPWSPRWVAKLRDAAALLEELAIRLCAVENLLQCPFEDVLGDLDEAGERAAG